MLPLFDPQKNGSYLASENDFFVYRVLKGEHKHFVDFLVEDSIIVECKAVDRLCTDHRQQLWNYMRLTGKQIGVLYNFGAVMGQSEHYYLDTDGTMYRF